MAQLLPIALAVPFALLCGGRLGRISALKLRKPLYSPTSAYGHFGRKPFSRRVNGKNVDFFTWEQTDRAQALLRALR